MIARHMKKTGPHSAQDLGMFKGARDARCPRVPDTISDHATLKQWIDGYDTAIRYVDDQIARLIESLKRAGVYEETAIVISAAGESDPSEAVEWECRSITPPTVQPLVANGGSLGAGSVAIAERTLNAR